MLVSPNPHERYLASLRYYVFVSINERGIKAKDLRNLKKLYLAEAILNRNFTESIDINKLSNNILGAAKYLKPNIKFKAKITGNYLINKNLFSCLLLSVTEKSPLLLFTKGDFLCIKCQGKADIYLPIISALNGFILHEAVTNKTAIIIPAAKTNQKSNCCDSEWEYLFNRFSVVNLYFSDKS